MIEDDLILLRYPYRYLDPRSYIYNIPRCDLAILIYEQHYAAIFDIETHYGHDVSALTLSFF